MGGEAFGAVTVRVSAELGRGTALSVRPRAVASALSQAVGALAARHTFPAQRAEKSAELKAILARGAAFVTRYSIEEESVEEGVYRMKLSAEVDREALLRELQDSGFSVARLEAAPRLLVLSGPGERSVAAANLVARLFSSEGIPAEVREEEAPAPEPLLARAGAAGFHVVAFVTAGVPRVAPGEEGENPAEVGPLPDPEAATPEESPATVELAVAGKLFDTRAGEVLGSGEVASVGSGPTFAEALDDGADRGGEDLFGLLVSDLVRSEWKLGDAALPMELKVAGIESPGLVFELTELFSRMPELRSVELDRVEAKSAVWTARAVNPESDFLGALSRVRPERGVLQWRAASPPKAKTPLFEGLWTAR